jgi:YVTN family beta-propeller protein
MTANLTRTLLASAAGIGMLLAFAGQPASAGTVRVYATNSGGDNLHVIDPSTNKVESIIKGIEGAHGVAFSPDGTRVYVSNEADSTLDVFDQKTGTLTKKVPLSGHPNNIAVAKDGRIVVAIAREPGALDIIDPVKLERKVSVQVKGRLHNAYVTPDSKYAIMGSTRTSMFSVVDLAKEELAWDLNIGKGVRPMTIDTNPDGSTRNVYIQTTDLNGFVVLDFASRKVVQTVELPKDGGVEVIHHRLDSPSHGIGVTPDNKTLWVTSILANAVVAYSLPDLKVIGRVGLPQLKVAGREPMASVPNWVTFTPDSKQIYISNAALNAVTAIDTVAMKEMAVIPVGQAPKRIGTLVAP